MIMFMITPLIIFMMYPIIVQTHALIVIAIHIMNFAIKEEEIIKKSDFKKR